MVDNDKIMDSDSAVTSYKQKRTHICTNIHSIDIHSFKLVVQLDSSVINGPKEQNTSDY